MHIFIHKPGQYNLIQKDSTRQLPPDSFFFLFFFLSSFFFLFFFPLFSSSSFFHPLFYNLFIRFLSLLSPSTRPPYIHPWTSPQHSSYPISPYQSLYRSIPALWYSSKPIGTIRTIGYLLIEGHGPPTHAKCRVNPIPRIITLSSSARANPALRRAGTCILGRIWGGHNGPGRGWDERDRRRWFGLQCQWS